MPVHTSAHMRAGVHTHTRSHTSMHTCHLALGKPICRLDWAGKTQSWQSRLWRNAGREDPHMSHFSGEAPLSTVQEAESGIKHFIASPVWGPQEAGSLIPVLQTGKQVQSSSLICQDHAAGCFRDDQLPPSLVGQESKSDAPLSEADRSAFLWPWSSQFLPHSLPLPPFFFF